jgi:predicted transglutaminase-like cysteine proteinase
VNIDVVIVFLRYPGLDYNNRLILYIEIALTHLKTITGLGIVAAVALTFRAGEILAVPLTPVPAAVQQAANQAGFVEVRKRKRRSKKRRRGGSVATASSSKAKLAKSKLSANALLFGTVETQSTNFKPFKKWRGAMAKTAKEQTDLAAFKKKFSKWVKFLDTLKGKDQLVQIKAVNKFMNQAKYIIDMKNWGIKDYWESPGEFFSKFGDCEDYSIAKYMGLKYLGFNPENMRVVAVKDLNLKVGHAILAVYYNKRILVLDNQIKIVADSRKIRHYQPVYSINEKYWWRHRVG